MELHLDMTDPVLPWNNGRWVVQVADGQAQAQRSGNGRLRLDVRDLAAMYTGHVLPVTLARVGSLIGSEPDPKAARLLFSSDSPALRDFFNKGGRRAITR